MSEKMTPGMRAQVLRLVAPYLVNDMLFRAQAEADRIEAEAFRDEAARREAGETRPLSAATPEIRALGKWLADKLQDDDWNNCEPHLIKVGAAIEALRARVKALEGVLDKYRAGIVTHVQMTGPVFGGTNSRQLKIAFEADQALAAGGTEADERAKGGRNG